MVAVESEQGPSLLYKHAVTWTGPENCRTKTLRLLAATYPKVVITKNLIDISRISLTSCSSLAFSVEERGHLQLGTYITQGPP